MKLIHTTFITLFELLITNFRPFYRTVAALNLRVEDGYLDPNSNYTAFVEVVVPEPGNPVKNVIGRSPYMIPRKPGEYVYPESGSSNSNVSKAIVTILAVLASLVTVALCLLLALLLLKKYSKNIPGSPGSDQVDGGEIPPDMRKSFTHFCNTIFRGKRDSQYLIQGVRKFGFKRCLDKCNLHCKIL